MQQEILKRLDALAEKLGVAANHLWQVLVLQVHNEAIVLLVVGTIAFIAGSAVATWGHRNLDEQGEGAAFAIVFGWGLVAVVGGLCITHGILYLLNPEYYALKEILEVLR
jgi:hypothetical protein